MVNHKDSHFMKKFLLCTAILLSLTLSVCVGGSGNSDSIVGTWKEYRDDPTDDYGLCTWKFNSDGSGYFMVEGYTNVQKMAFLWEKSGSTIRINHNDGNPTILKLNNGLLIEDNAFGPTVYRKR